MNRWGSDFLFEVYMARLSSGLNVNDKTGEKMRTPLAALTKIFDLAIGWVIGCLLLALPAFIGFTLIKGCEAGVEWVSSDEPETDESTELVESILESQQAYLEALSEEEREEIFNESLKRFEEIKDQPWDPDPRARIEKILKEQHREGNN